MSTITKKIDPEWMEDEMAHLGRWFREVAFDREHYCWRAGYNMSGIDHTRVVDGTSWGIGGIGPEVLESWGIDVDRLMESTERTFLASYQLPNGRMLYGFDITDPEGYQRRREPLVWFEATGQMCIAYGEVAKYYEKKGKRELSGKYRTKAFLYLSYMSGFKEYYELKECLPYMSVSPSQKQILKTMKDEWEIPRARHEDQWVGSVSSTMWFLYCAHKLYNPMAWESGGK